jgi:hypothetical protein
MTTLALQRMIGRALTERSFREKLLLSPQAAMREFPLSESEQAHIHSLRAVSLEEFSLALSERLMDPVDAGSDRRMA